MGTVGSANSHLSRFVPMMMVKSGHEQQLPLFDSGNLVRHTPKITASGLPSVTVLSGVPTRVSWKDLGVDVLVQMREDQTRKDARLLSRRSAGSRAMCTRSQSQTTAG
jgi:hypothetical protein